MRQGHDTFTIQLGDAIVQLPARTVVQTYLTTLLDQPASTPAPMLDNPPKIGECWPEQGGVYAGLMRGENGVPDYHLIVPTDPTSEAAEITWGGRGKEEPGAQSAFDGLANTTALCASKHDHPAAQWAAGLTIEGFNDFYLPSRRELRLCWVNVPELFNDGWHWSSTQFSASLAWSQGFGDGTQSTSGKLLGLRARAVRRFINDSVI
jgi:hypothetical protein